MEKRISYFIISLWLVIGGCQLDSTVTERDYPLIKSLAVTEIDGTGATVEFEILKEGKASVDAYGVEYRSQAAYDNFTFTEENTGSPKSINRIRLKYDLVKDQVYVVTPFVRKGQQMIRGEALEFTSKGIKDASVTSVSPSRLLAWHEVTIEGDFFPSDPRQVEVKIQGLEELFQIKVISSERKKIVFEANRIGSQAFPTELFGEKFDLVLRLYGSAFRFPGVFELDAPTIVSVDKTSVKVGETVSFSTSEPTEWVNNAHLVPEEGFGSIGVTVEKSGENNYSFTFPNLKAGKYKLRLKPILWEDFVEYPEPITVLSSWELAATIDPNTHHFTHFENFGETVFGVNQDQSTVSFFDHLSGNLSFCCQLPENPKPRNIAGYGFLYLRNENAIYYGLGGYYPVNSEDVLRYTDFHKFDLDSKKWTKLPDMSEGPTFVNKIFELNGLIYVVFLNRESYFYFNPSNQTWIDTGILVPQEFKDSQAYAIANNRVYFLGRSFEQSQLIIRSLTIGTEPIPVSSGTWYDRDGQPSMVGFQNQLFISDGSREIFRLNLTDNKLTPLQSIPFAEKRRGKLFVIEGNVFFGLPDARVYPEQFELHRLLD